MPLCKPYLRALTRSFAVGSALSGVMLLFWLVAAIALAQLIDAVRGNEQLAALVPQLTVLAISVMGAFIIQLSRHTLLQRRRIWLEHGLREVVLAHELWLGADTRHRTRNLAAVDAVARFTGSQAAAALVEAPWTIIVVGGLWGFNPDIAAATSAAAFIVLALALSGSRVRLTSKHFDATLMADTAGLQIINSTAVDTITSLDYARSVAARWEITQRGSIAASYREAQRRSRRFVVCALINLLACGTIAAAAASASAGTGLSTGNLTVLALVAAGALASLSRWLLDAPIVAASRSAHRQLRTLRVARTRSGDARLPSINAPDLRVPIATGLFATAVTLAGLTGAIVYWQLPPFSIFRDGFALATPVTTPTQTAMRARSPADTKDLDRDIAQLRGELATQRFRLAELKQEATTVRGIHAATEPKPAVLATIEAAAARLTTNMQSLLQRLTALERDLTDAQQTKTSSSPPPSATAVTKGLS